MCSLLLHVRVTFLGHSTPPYDVAALLLPVAAAAPGYTGDLLPDTLVSFSCPAALGALSCLTHLGLSESALPGPWSVEEWLQPLRHLHSLQFVLQDDPASSTNRTTVTAGTSSAACSAGGVAGGANAGLLGTGNLSAALAAAAQAAGNSRADQQLAVAQQNLLAGLQNLSSALQQAANSGAFGRVAGSASSSSSHHTQHHHHHTPHQISPAGPSASSSAGGAAAPAAAAAAGGHIARTSSSTSTTEADAPSTSDAAAAAGTVAAAASRPLLPVSFSSCCPGLNTLVLANLYGERLIKMTIPNSLTRLVLHLANPAPGTVNGEQLAAVVLQAAESLLSLELGLGMRFSLSGAVMRGLKRSLKHLRDLTLIEGAQDHLEGLGCWCNLPRLTLVEGRCTVPLRGLYELSMRAAMGRTPGVLRYHGHARHVEELASRLGAALQELRLDSLSGLGSGYRSNSGAHDSGSGSSSSTPGGSPSAVKQQEGASDSDSLTECGSSSRPADGGEQEAQPLPALAQLSCMTRLEVVGEQIGQLDAYGVLVLSNCKHLQVLAIEGHEPWLAADRGVKEQLDWLAELPQLRQLRLAGVMLGRSKLGAAGGADSTAGRDGAAADSSSSADGKGGKKGSGSGRGSSAGGKTGASSSSGGGAGAVPAVRGLGNGLGAGAPVKGPGGRGPLATDPEARAAAIAKARAEEAEGAGDEQYESAYTAVVCAAAMQFQDMQLKALSGQPAGASNWAQAYEAAQQEARVAVCLEELRRWLCQMLPNCRVWLD